MVILAGEIGEKTKLALFTHEFDTEQNKYIIKNLVASQIYATKDYENGLENVIEVFLKDTKFYDEKYKYGEGLDQEILGACFGIAGQVQSTGQTEIKRENLDVTFTEDAFKQKLPCPGVPTSFHNDMVAIGNAIFLGKGEDELDLLYEGEKKADLKNRRCIMLVGDGLGQALWQVTEKQPALFPTSSEGGHCRFAPQTQKEWDLCLSIKKEIQKDLAEKHGENIELDQIKVRFEDILSRRGLVRIYQFLGNGGETLNSKQILEKATQLEHPDNLCKEALEMFITIWGARAGDLGITYESEVGIYIGGISTDIDSFKEHFSESTFVKAFLEKEIKNSRNYQNNRHITIKIFKEEDRVLWGAVRYAIDNGYVTRGKLAWKQMMR